MKQTCSLSLYIGSEITEIKYPINKTNLSDNFWNKDAVGIEMNRGLAMWNESFFDFDSINKELERTIYLYFLITFDDSGKWL